MYLFLNFISMNICLLVLGFYNFVCFSDSDFQGKLNLYNNAINLNEEQN